MGRTFKIVISILVLMIAGCGSTEEQTNLPNLSDDSANNKSAETKPDKKEAFSNPVVPGKKTQEAATAPSTPNLINSTNPTERVKFVAKGRPDPFARIVSPEVIKKPTTVSQQPTRPVPPVPVLPGSSLRNRRSRVIPATLNPKQIEARKRILEGRRKALEARRKQVLQAKKQALQKRKQVLQAKKQAVKTRKNLPKAISKSNQIPVEPQKLPQVTSNPELTAVLPPPPQPELANGVMVTGVVLVGSNPQAIIKVPNERTSRYVSSGARLANGVLVKRIEMNDGSNPVVILEQYGIEVAKMVGEKPVSDSTAATANNSVSVRPQPVNYVSTGAS
ncbi:MAG: hypothetical protein AAF378_13270 [Cyanobacteria bacterium P01_A01_bin.84]